MRNYTPNERIVDRAVELWKRALANPKYDNGDSSLGGIMTAGLAGQLPTNATPEVLKKFGDHLKSLLMNPDRQYGNKDIYISYLAVDYHPDLCLAEAAEKAGLKMEFPWKTYMYLTSENVCFAQGYCAPHVYHYPLSGGKWLITTLQGEDINKVIKWCEGEGQPEFEIERGEA